MKSVVATITAASARILAFRIKNEEIDFTFEVWAYGLMSGEGLQGAHRDFMGRQDTHDKRQSLRGVTIKQFTNHGLPAASR